MYFGGSLVLTAGSAMACFRNRVIMNAVMSNSWLVRVYTSISNPLLKLQLFNVVFTL
jgi:hypothetical protein